MAKVLQCADHLLGAPGGLGLRSKVKSKSPAASREAPTSHQPAGVGRKGHERVRAGEGEEVTGNPKGSQTNPGETLSTMGLMNNNFLKMTSNILAHISHPTDAIKV